MSKKSINKTLDHLVDFSDFLNIESEYFTKMMAIIKDKPFSTEKVKGYNLHHIIPRSISKYFGQKPQDDKMVLLSISEHFLVHYYMDKCRLDGFGHHLSPSWRLILSNNKKQIFQFLQQGDFAAELIAEIMNSKSYDLSKNDKENFHRKEVDWDLRALHKLENQISKFFDENIPIEYQDAFFDFIDAIDMPFSLAQTKKAWKYFWYLINNPKEVLLIKWLLEDSDRLAEYEHQFRSNYVKQGYLNNPNLGKQHNITMNKGRKYHSKG